MNKSIIINIIDENCNKYKILIYFMCVNMCVYVHHVYAIDLNISRRGRNSNSKKEDDRITGISI